MADTAHKTKDEIKEIFDSPEVLRSKAKKLAKSIRGSKKFFIFTGAGISTSTGIPDFRGPDGVWTCRAEGRAVPRDKGRASALKAIPSVAHMAIVALVEKGLCHYVVSQNCDGLHRRSGIPADKISELHGNSNIETCSKCKMEYLRDFRCRRQGIKVHDHKTGRSCSKCGGALKDSIINFGENLPSKPLRLAEKMASEADLCLVLGSSCRVTPAADIPEEVGTRGESLVICNLQKTPLDHLSNNRIYGKTDELMKMVMEELGLEIPTYVLRRRVTISTEVGGSIKRQGGGLGRPSSSRHSGPWPVGKAASAGQTAEAGVLVNIAATDVNGTPATYFTKVDVHAGSTVTELAPENMLISEVTMGPARPSASAPTDVRVAFHFVGHYGEDNITVHHQAPHGVSVTYGLDYTPSLKSWKVHTVATPK